MELLPSRTWSFAGCLLLRPKVIRSIQRQENLSRRAHGVRQSAERRV